MSAIAEMNRCKLDRFADMLLFIVPGERGAKTNIKNKCRKDSHRTAARERHSRLRDQ